MAHHDGIGSPGPRVCGQSATTAWSSRRTTSAHADGSPNAARPAGRNQVWHSDVSEFLQYVLASCGSSVRSSSVRALDQLVHGHHVPGPHGCDGVPIDLGGDVDRPVPEGVGDVLDRHPGGGQQ